MKWLLHRGSPASREAPAAPGRNASGGPGIRLIVGLGNPGPEYAGNRHNVGAWTVNRLARAHGVRLKAAGKLANIGEGTVCGRPVILARPRVFMNDAGRAVKSLVDRFRIRPQELLVIYDDLDLPTGRVRVRARGGHAGHRGLGSIVRELGTDDVPRIRIGIGRPLVDGAPTWDPEEIAAYVLSNPGPEERAALEDGVARAAEAVEAILRGGVEAAMNAYNATG